MNPKFLGDSYDLVKRFFIEQLEILGYSVVIDPMFTGNWNGCETDFFRLIGLSNFKVAASTATPALFIDPDTGIQRSGSKRHVSYDRIVRETMSYRLVLSFDQSFSRQAKATEVMQAKLSTLRAHGITGMYYDSHARFLFAAKDASVVINLRDHLISIGLPLHRFVLSEDVHSERQP